SKQKVLRASADHMKRDGWASRRRHWIGFAAALIPFAATILVVFVAMRAPHTIASSLSPRASDPARASSSRTVVAANPAHRISLSKQPLSFGPNLGQSDPAVKFLSRGQGYSPFLTGSEAVLSMTSAAPRDAGFLRGAPLSAFSKSGKTASDGLR